MSLFEDHTEQILSQYSNEDKLRAEVARLRAELEEIARSYERVVRGECAPDERHCTCVPALRAEIGKLEARVVQLERVVDMVLQTATISTPPELLALASQVMPSVCCAPHAPRKLEAS